jgi:hypothetical protein
LPVPDALKQAMTIQWDRASGADLKFVERVDEQSLESLRASTALPIRPQLPGQVANDFAAAAPKCSSSSCPDGSMKRRIFNS